MAWNAWNVIQTTEPLDILRTLRGDVNDFVRPAI